MPCSDGPSRYRSLAFHRIAATQLVRNIPAFGAVDQAGGHVPGGEFAGRAVALARAWIHSLSPFHEKAMALTAWLSDTRRLSAICPLFMSITVTADSPPLIASRRPCAARHAGRVVRGGRGQIEAGRPLAGSMMRNIWAPSASVAGASAQPPAWLPKKLAGRGLDAAADAGRVRVDAVAVAIGGPEQAIAEMDGRAMAPGQGVFHRIAGGAARLRVPGVLAPAALRRQRVCWSSRRRATPPPARMVQLLTRQVCMPGAGA